MKLETHVTQGWRKIVAHYRLLQDPHHFGFAIEAVGQLAENPRLWIEGDAAVIHHSPGIFIVLANMPGHLIEEIALRDVVLLSEQYRRHYADGLVPWGMDKVGGDGHTYTVPVIHTEHIGDIRKIFNTMPVTASTEELQSPVAE